MIINLTQHAASDEQISAGVVDLTGDAREVLIKELTFVGLPTKEEIRSRAARIAHLVSGRSVINGAPATKVRGAMIGGAPYLMADLEGELVWFGIYPMYAFSERKSVEKNGVKTSVFKHLGFIEIVI